MFCNSDCAFPQSPRRRHWTEPRNRDRLCSSMNKTHETIRPANRINATSFKLALSLSNCAGFLLSPMPFTLNFYSKTSPGQWALVRRNLAASGLWPGTHASGPPELSWPLPGGSAPAQAAPAWGDTLLLFCLPHLLEGPGAVVREATFPQAPELRAQQAHQRGPQPAAGHQVFHHEGREQVDVQRRAVQPESNVRRSVGLVGLREVGAARQSARFWIILSSPLHFTYTVT